MGEEICVGDQLFIQREGDMIGHDFYLQNYEFLDQPCYPSCEGLSRRVLCTNKETRLFSSGGFGNRKNQLAARAQHHISCDSQRPVASRLVVPVSFVGHRRRTEQFAVRASIVLPTMHGSPHNSNISLFVLASGIWFLFFSLPSNQPVGSPSRQRGSLLSSLWRWLWRCGCYCL